MYDHEKKENDPEALKNLSDTLESDVVIEHEKINNKFYVGVLEKL
ncbi:MAG: hypothetical protein NWS46_09475 [Cyclobacteriaceae bacterium]|nr:hypothetical protein [Cyclobacteriaceae bacterium]